MTTSDKMNQGLRLLDMAWTIIRHRKQYAVAQVDVFSGKAFIWSEVCTWLLKKLRKPVILTLHGGKLPEFARQHPKRVKRVLQAADAVVSPSPYHQIRLERIPRRYPSYSKSGQYQIFRDFFFGSRLNQNWCGYGHSMRFIILRWRSRSCSCLFLSFLRANC